MEGMGGKHGKGGKEEQGEVLTPNEEDEQSM